MNHSPGIEPRKRRPVWLWVLLGCFGMFAACVLSVVSMFFLSSDARVLRDSVSEGRGSGSLKTRIQLSLGPVSTSLVRLAVGCVDGVDKDARLALSAVHGVSVGVYELEGESREKPRQVDFDRTDRCMKDRGWSRLVTVREHRQTVLVYGPAEDDGGSSMPLCLAVCDGNKLIVVSVKGDLEPVVELAQKHIAQSKKHML